MEMLIGWGLLTGVVLMVWLVIRFAGGARGEPHASCGVDGCSGSGKARSSRRT